ncbi:hypothetical protein EUGRSUZ_E00115 [Eucalyptus grandis]|uniref:RING-type E3 ubiquitin transferase n=3 Tax=Eucalyptus grandis TaxID=71139 RepID=A0A059C051_EUCGR|nr:hypothetical protein EUGRSUZ_E00115 [Eucalyptus grandis]
MAESNWAEGGRLRRRQKPPPPPPRLLLPRETAARPPSPSFSRKGQFRFFFYDDASGILPVMGGCCCSTRKAHLNGAPVYYYYPPSLEEHESLTSHDATAAAITSGFLVDLQLEASIPDNFRPPPPPLPYDAVLGSLPISTDSVRESVCLDHTEPDCKAQSTAPLGSPKAIEVSKSNDTDVSVADEEDVCPICLEEYDEDNPRFITKCEHHFHLSCILEWMERSDVCPICDKIMEFDNSFDL